MNSIFSGRALYPQREHAKKQDEIATLHEIEARLRWQPWFLIAFYRHEVLVDVRVCPEERPTFDTRHDRGIPNERIEVHFSGIGSRAHAKLCAIADKWRKRDGLPRHR